MNTSRCELVVYNEQDLNKLKSIWNRFKVNRVYCVTSLITHLGMVRMMLGAKFEIFAMVDTPLGTNRGIKKFTHMEHTGFLVEGYDVVLSNAVRSDEAALEIKSITEFVKTLINKSTKVVFTINANTRSQEFIKDISVFINKHPIDGIKLEAITNYKNDIVNDSKHGESIKTISGECNTKIIICGNVSYNTYSNFQKCNVAISPDQILKLLDQEESALRRVKVSKEELTSNAG